MSNKETITVKFPGKFGPNVDGVFYSIDQKSGLTPEQFEKGKTYEVLTYASKSGKKYISQIVGEPAAPVAAVEKAGDDKIIQKPVVTTSEAVTVAKEWKGRDFDAEARGKIACALRAALYASPALTMFSTTFEEWQKKVDEEVKRGSLEVLKAQKGE